MNAAPFQRGGGAALPPDASACVRRVEEYLDEFIGTLALGAALTEACRYALLSGGKRLRPMLAWHSAVAAGGSGEDALPAAGAVELIHAFSLVHDDLPALDNDDLRRGRPTLHRHAGEAMAILAGDAMMTLAFKLVADRSPTAARAAELTRELSDAATRMIVGQVYDTLGGVDERLDRAEQVRLIHTNKTGALIRASCRMGAISALGRADDPAVEALTRFGEAIGLMFQIVDDVLDVTQPTEQLGKRASKDAAAGKLTYPGVLGIDGARAQIERVRGAAHEALDRLPPGAGVETLRALCEYLAVRTS